MVLNNGFPKIEVYPESLIARINGETVETKPHKIPTLSRLYNII
jgi:urease alpha subunit